MEKTVADFAEYRRAVETDQITGFWSSMYQSCPCSWLSQPVALTLHYTVAAAAFAAWDLLLSLSDEVGNKPTSSKH